MEEQIVTETEQPTPRRTTVRDEEEKRSLINRISRIEGQLRGVKRMLEEDGYCTDILVQAAAARAAIKSFNKALLENHMRCCVADEIRAGNDEVMAELAHALHKLV